MSSNNEVNEHIERTAEDPDAETAGNNESESAALQAARAQSTANTTRRSSQSASDSVRKSAFGNIEDRIAAKVRASTGAGSSTNNTSSIGAVASTKEHASTIKASGRTASESRASQQVAINQLEADVEAKARARASTMQAPTPTQTVGAYDTIRATIQRNADISFKLDSDSIREFPSERENDTVDVSTKPIESFTNIIDNNRPAQTSRDPSFRVNDSIPQQNDVELFEMEPSEPEPETTPLNQFSNYETPQSVVGPSTYSGHYGETYPAPFEGETTVEFTDGGAITAELAPTENVVETLAVEVIQTEEEQLTDAKKKLWKYGAASILCVTVLVIAIMVPLSLTVLKEGPQENVTVVVVTEPPTSPPSSVPTTAPSSAPTSELYTEYVDRLSSVSSLSLLQNSSTPQYKALQWLFYDDPLGRRPLTDERLVQRYVLAVFYYSTSEGAGWADCFQGDICTSNRQESWLSNSDECDWYGFNLCENGFVKVFSVVNNNNNDGYTWYGNNLDGTLPEEFGELITLEDITLLDNVNLRSTIPASFGKLTNLRNFLISNSTMEGSVENLFENMTEIRSIRLSRNYLTGKLPVFNKAPPLRDLEIQRNNFTGNIYPEYGNLSALGTLWLNDNHIDGQIPPSFGNLKELERLSLSNNFLDGPIPAELGNLPQLSELDLSENFFSNELPPSFINIGNETTRRKKINLENNRFEGDVSALSEIPGLDELLLQYNDFTGEVICRRRERKISVDCDEVTCECCDPDCKLSM